MSVGYDTQANSPIRLRRNAQRSNAGSITKLVNVTAPLTNNGTAIGISTGNGLTVSGGTLLVLLADTSLSESGAGVKVNLATNPGLTVSSGLKLLLADTSLSLAAGGVAVALNTAGGLQTSSGLELKLADTSLKLAAGGVSVNEATSSALTVSSGLKVNVDGVTVTINGSNQLVASGGSGTVTSVALSAPSIFTVAGSPVTTTGTLALSLATQSSNTIFAGPTTGVAAIPTFRSLVAADIPVSAVFPVVTTDPTSPTAGEAWFNSTASVPRVFLNTDGTNKLQSTIPGVILSTAGPQNVSANTSPQTFGGSSLTFPSAVLNRAGAILEFFGVFTAFTPTTGGNTCSYQMVIGSNIITLFTTAALGTNGTAVLLVNGLIGVQSTGSSGTFFYAFSLSGTNPAPTAFTSFIDGALTQNLTGTVAFHLTASATAVHAGDTLGLQSFTLKLVA